MFFNGNDCGIRVGDGVEKKEKKMKVSKVVEEKEKKGE